MTDPDEAVVERVAAVLAESHWERPVWHEMEPHDRADYLRDARAALRLLASEGRLCEPGTVAALEAITEASELWSKMHMRHPTNETHFDRVRTRALLRCRTDEARAALPKPGG